MTLDEILHGLFPRGHDVKAGKDGSVIGHGKRRGGGPIAVIGVANGTPLGTAGVLPLAEHALGVVEQGGDTPTLVLVDTEGQLMARREKMIGPNEYLAHLAKCLLRFGAGGARAQAAAVHRDFVARRLSPGGCADLLAFTLFLGGLAFFA